MTRGVELTPFRGLAALQAARSDWACAFERADVDPLGNAPDWGLAYASAWLRDAEVFGWTARCGGDVVGFLPLRHEPRRSPLALRRALLLPDGTFDSDYLDLVVRPEHRAEVLDALLFELDRTRGVDAVVFSCIPTDSPTPGLLREALRVRRRPFREREVPCLAAPLPGTFDAYLRGLPKRMRTKVRRALREAAARGARHAWTAATDLEELLEQLFALHTARWNAIGRPGSFGDERRRRFYADLAQAWAEQGKLRMVRLELDGEVVAIQFGVREGDTYYQMQEGYAPEHASWRAATALRALAVSDLIDEGVRDYDFMGGDDRHKLDWGGVPRPCRTFAFPVGGLRARAAYRLRALLDARAERAAT